MRKRSFLWVLIFFTFRVGLAMAGTDGYVGSGAAVILKARAEAPVEQRRQGNTEATGTLLFSMVGPDNAACVRALGDVNGDGRDEIIVGIDESQTTNVYCLDGASSGTATVVWSFETADGVSGGAPWGDQSVVPISDTDGNGYPNFLLGTAWGGRTAYNVDGQAGSLVWKYDTYLATDSGWVYSLCELNDIVGDDGVPEGAFGAGSDSDSLYMIDGASSSSGQATVVWRYAAADSVSSVRNIGDVNGDGDHDVLAAIGDLGQKLVCLSGGTSLPGGELVWQYSTGVSAYACGVLPDITGDGVNEALAVLWTTGGGAIRCINGATGAHIWTSTAVNEYAMMVDIIADLTGDGHDEVVVSSFENAVIVLDGADGSLVWKSLVGTLNGGDVWTARAIADLNGDAIPDVVAGSFDYNVYAMDGKTGSTIWTWDTDNRVFSVSALGDLNGDGYPEVVAGTQDTNNSVVVQVLDGGPGAGIFADGFESGDTGAWSSTTP